MSETAFKPGPWGTNGSHIYAPDGEILAQVHNPGRCASDYPLVPNRNLMAAAPELYEAADILERAIAAYSAEVDEPCWDDLRAKLRAALAKARGEQVPA